MKSEFHAVVVYVKALNGWMNELKVRRVRKTLEFCGEAKDVLSSIVWLIRCKRKILIVGFNHDFGGFVCCIRVLIYHNGLTIILGLYVNCVD